MGVTDYTNLTPSKHLERKMPKFKTPNMKQNIRETCAKSEMHIFNRIIMQSFHIKE